MASRADAVFVDDPPRSPSVWPVLYYNPPGARKFRKQPRANGSRSLASPRIHRSNIPPAISFSALTRSEIFTNCCLYRVVPTMSYRYSNNPQSVSASAFGFVIKIVSISPCRIRNRLCSKTFRAVFFFLLEIDLPVVRNPLRTASPIKNLPQLRPQLYSSMRVEAPTNFATSSYSSLMNSLSQQVGASLGLHFHIQPTVSS
ncbi:uncharacterized protein LOC119767701 [Culex quinquefasciatus]|uniref:uncharacterized protein LOC119767701 n=1 Tax=Culex quinquefasciatus TaxID=7176 RepID=UPI0018E29752|nr:uncharacterized protein LOC119767701 [Culex quinquefasciatus]